MSRQVLRLFTWPRVLVALLLVPVIAFGVERWMPGQSCSPCHTELTAKLPELDSSVTEGLVRIRANSMEFRARVAGLDNHDGDGVILLHGYPETSIMWQAALDRLARSGFRVVAFDQRGYSPGARPGRVPSYAVEELAGDVVAIADAAGFERFHLVGHDWGGMVGWIAAGRYPDRIATWTSLSIPHPGAYGEALSLVSGTDQLRRSSYMLLNWIPWLSELVLGFDNAAFLRHFSWRERSRELRQEYVSVFSEPGALKAVLSWYRANMFLASGDFGKTRQPTLYVWGNTDKSLGRVGADKTADYVEGPFRFMKLSAGHALMAEAPDVVLQEIVSHLENWKIGRSAPTRPVSLTAISPGSASCTSSKPDCLRVTVSPFGQMVRVVNRCESRFKGMIRMRCTAWKKGAFVDYRFDLAPGGVMLHDPQGLSFGDCYYGQQVCPVRGAVQAQSATFGLP